MAGTLADAYVDIRGKTDNLLKDIDSAASRGGTLGGRTFADRFDRSVVENGNGNPLSRLWASLRGDAEKGGDDAGDGFRQRLVSRIGNSSGGGLLRRLWDFLRVDAVNNGRLTGQAYTDELDKTLKKRASGGGGKDVSPLEALWRTITFDAGRGGRGAAGAFVVGLAAAFSPALPGLALQLTAALAPLVGIIGLIPAIAVTAGGGIATLNIALNNMKDAIGAGLSGDVTKFNAAIKGMAPSALGVVRAFVALKPALDALKKTVQGNFFSGLASDVTILGKTYLPLLQRTLGATATSFNGFLRSMAATAESPKFIANITTALGGVSTIISTLLQHVPQFAAALAQVAAVGTPILVRLAGTISGIVDRFADFLSETASDGRLASFINGAITAFGQLFTVLGELGGIIHGIVTISSQAGGNLLGTFGNLLKTVNDFVHSTAGIQVLSSVFFGLGQTTDAFASALKGILSGLGPFLSVLPGVFAGLVTAIAPLLPLAAQLVNALGVGLLDVLSALTPALSSIVQELTTALTPVFPVLTEVLRQLAPVLGQIASLAAQFLAPALQAVSQVLVAVLPMFSQVAVAMGGALVSALQQLLPSLLKLLPALTQLALDVLPKLLPSVLEMVKAFVAWLPAIIAVVNLLVGILVPVIKLLTPVIVGFAEAIAFLMSWMARIIGWIGQFVSWLLKLVVAFLLAKSTWDAVGNFFVSFGTTINNFFRDFGQKVNTSFMTGLKQMYDGVVSFGRMVIGAFQSAWNAVVSAVVSACDSIISFIKGLVPKTLGALSSFGSTISGVFRSGMSLAASAVTGGISGLVSLAASIPGRILGALGSLGGLLAGVGHDIIDGLIGGIKDRIGALASAAANAASAALNAAKAAIGISSPSRAFRDEVGSPMVQGAIAGIQDMQASLYAQVATTFGRTPNAAVAAMAGTTTNTSNVNFSPTYNLGGTVDPQQLANATMSRLVFAMNTGVIR